MNTSRPALWLRDEPKRGERRAALTPSAVKALVAAGFEVTVERSAARAFADAEYASSGARLVDSEAWRRAPPDAVIVGLKELDASLGPFTRRHVHFAHAFKRQHGWDTLLAAFARGGGRLFDLEYLVDERGRRIAAFGYWAGYVGAALGVLALAAQRGGTGSVPGPLHGPLDAWSDRDALLVDVRAARDALASGPSGATGAPAALVFGALGRSGRGAVDLLRAAGIEPSRRDRDETAPGGPFDAVLEHELVINCVFVAEPVPAFTTLEHLSGRGRRTRVIVDVSCDPFGEANVLPVYACPTTLDVPVSRLIDGAASDAAVPPLDLIAIDHLPALLPRESSEDFCAQLLPALLALGGGNGDGGGDGDGFAHGPFGRAAAVFERERDAALAIRSGTAKGAPSTGDAP